MSLYNRSHLYSSVGSRKSLSLFKEFTTADTRAGAIFVMNKYDRIGLRSLYKLYMTYAIDDPTEHTFAIEVFGEYAFWEWLRGMKPVKGMIGDWEREAEVARKSKLIDNLIEATKDPKTSFAASKYLLERGFDQRPSQVGVDQRKSRKESKSVTQEILQQEGYESDLERIRTAFDS